MSPFEFLNSINHSKKDVMVDDLTEKSYNDLNQNVEKISVNHQIFGAAKVSGCPLPV